MRVLDIKKNILNELEKENKRMEEKAENLKKELKLNDDREAYKSKIEEQEKFRNELIKIKKTNEKNLKIAEDYVISNKNNLEIVDFIVKSLDIKSNLSKDFSYYFEHYIKKKLINNDQFKQNIEEISDYYCPLSKKIMLDPYITECGHSFEHQFLVKFTENNRDSKCPICSKPLNVQNSSENVKLKQIINHWYQKNLINKNSVQDDDIKNDEEYKNALAEEQLLIKSIDECERKIEFDRHKLKEIKSFINKWKEANIKETINSSSQNEFGPSSLIEIPNQSSTCIETDIVPNVVNEDPKLTETNFASYKPENATLNPFVSPSLPAQPSPIQKQNPPSAPSRPFSIPIPTPPPMQSVIPKPPPIPSSISMPPPPPAFINSNNSSRVQQLETSNQDRSNLMSEIRNFGGNLSNLKKIETKQKLNDKNDSEKVTKKTNDLLVTLNRALQQRRVYLDQNSSPEEDNEDFDA
jgi:hypothetical protein